MHNELLTGRISVPRRAVVEAKQAMAAALRAIVTEIPGAEFKEVYSRSERWGPRDPGGVMDEALQIMLDNRTLCEPIHLPEDLADEL